MEEFVGSIQRFSNSLFQFCRVDFVVCRVGLQPYVIATKFNIAVNIISTVELKIFHYKGV